MRVSGGALAATLAALLARRPLLLVLVLPYARATKNAAHIAGDMVGFLALVKGSVRARRVVI